MQPPITPRGTWDHRTDELVHPQPAPRRRELQEHVVLRERQQTHLQQPALDALDRCGVGRDERPPRLLAPLLEDAPRFPFLFARPLGHKNTLAECRWSLHFRPGRDLPRLLAHQFILDSFYQSFLLLLPVLSDEDGHALDGVDPVAAVVPGVFGV